MDVAIKEVRQAKCSAAVNGLMESGSLRDYPEVSHHELSVADFSCVRELTNTSEW